MSHPVALPSPRLTKADLATLRYLIARTAEPTEAADPAPVPAHVPGPIWLERRCPPL